MCKFVKCFLSHILFPFFQQYVESQPCLVETWKYNIRRNVNSDISTVTMCRVAIIFFELGVVKKFIQKLLFFV